MEAQEKIPEEEPLRKEDLDNFVNGMLPGCLALMDDVPDIVARYVEGSRHALRGPVEVEYNNKAF